MRRTLPSVPAEEEDEEDEGGEEEEKGEDDEEEQDLRDTTSALHLHCRCQCSSTTRLKEEEEGEEEEERRTARRSSNSRWSVTWRSVVLAALLLGAAVGLAGAAEEEKGDHKDAKCIPAKSLKEMKILQGLKRHIIHNVNQTTIPLTIANSDRISHRLTNNIFKIFLQEVVGYQEVELVHFEDDMNPKILKNPFLFPDPESPPETLVNLEKWIPPAVPDHETENMNTRGSQGTGGRFGWYVSVGNYSKSESESEPESESESDFILDHWRSYQDERVASLFALTDKEVEEVKSYFTTDSQGNYNCPPPSCEGGMFTPDVCRVRTCVTLFAGQFKYSSFLMAQVTQQALLVQVAWIGVNLTPEFVQRFRGGSGPLLFFSWWPSPVSVLDNLVRVGFPSCTEVSLYNTQQNYLCKYEMHTLRKTSWMRLEEYGIYAYDAVERFSLKDDDYRTILHEYNRRTAFGNSKPLFQPSRRHGWDDQIIYSIACDWLNHTSLTQLKKIETWRPHEFNKKPELWFAGIFPISDATGKYSSKTLADAANMAIDDINQNATILNDYKLKLMSVDGSCSIDEVLFAYISYLRAPQLEKLIGILGPSCTNTVEPLAGVAKQFNTVIISYSAEGAVVNDEDKHSYFFRTIPENKQYRYVYLQLFKRMKWKRLASLTEDGSKYSKYLIHLHENLQQENISINNLKYPSRDPKVDVFKYLTLLKRDSYHIIIGDFYSGMACKVMCDAFKLKMKAHEGFVWFLPRWFESGWYANCNQINGTKITCSLDDMLTSLDGHLSLGYAYYASNDTTYHSGQTVGHWKRDYEVRRHQPPADYAGYTYDAVWTYAFALHKLLNESYTHGANLRSDKTNGRFVELIRETDFQGVSGHINFPESSSRKTIISIMQFRSNFTTKVGQYYTVGNFQPDETMKGGGQLNLEPDAIKWLTPDTKRPKDGSPPPLVCTLESFQKLLGVSCEFTIVITMLISFAIFACITIALFCIYKIKYEKIEQHPWELRNLMNLDEWEIPRERVKINRTIGAGAFGTVFGGECMIHENTGWAAVAVKTLKKGSTAENKLDFLGEAEMMKRFDHINIVKFIGLSTTLDSIYMIMEFMLYGDLQTYLLGRRHLVSERSFYNGDDEISNRRLTSMALNVACALEYLASNKYVHRDVACRNCLVNADRVVKLSDFGMTRPTYENNYYRFNRKGMLPVRWMAPESIEDGIYTTKTDIWSYGVLLYEIITFGNFPFQGLSNNEVLEHVVKFGNTIRIPTGVQPQLSHILSRCWSKDPEQRPDFPELVEWFSTYTRLITPCIEVPLASVPTNNSDSLPEISIDSVRNFTMPKSHVKQNQAQQQQQQQQQQQRKLQQEAATIMPFTGNSSDASYSINPLYPDASTCIGGPACSSSGSTRTRRNRAPVENGGGPTAEPLLSLAMADSYITRYACLQLNNKSPDGSEPPPGSSSTPMGSMTAV